jgi:uncharacterized protein (UPF0264 family)
MDARTVRLLVSVRNAVEAAEALEGGADVIDIKDPGRGSLGRADDQAMRSILSVVGGVVPISVAMGEWDDSDPCVPPRGARYVKVGLARGAGRGWSRALQAWVDAVAPIGVIAVAYADHHRVNAPSPKEVLDWAAAQGVAGLLIDTAVKDGSGLFDWMDPVRVRSMVLAAREAGKRVALAGSLHGANLFRAVELGPDIVAVRSAACVGHDRQASVDRGCVAELRGIIGSRTVAAGLP